MLFQNIINTKIINEIFYTQVLKIQRAFYSYCTFISDQLHFKCLVTATGLDRIAVFISYREVS